MFADRTQAALYKNSKAYSTIDDSKEEVNESKKLLEKVYRRGNMFEGAELDNNNRGGGGPIEFEKDSEEYGLNSIHDKSKSKKK